MFDRRSSPIRATRSPSVLRCVRSHGSNSTRNRSSSAETSITRSSELTPSGASELCIASETAAGYELSTAKASSSSASCAAAVELSCSFAGRGGRPRKGASFGACWPSSSSRSYPGFE